MNTKTLLRPFTDFRSTASINEDIDQELQFHLDCRTDELCESGLPPDQARSRAISEFGDMNQVRRQCRTINYGWRWILNLALAAMLLGSLGAITWLSLQLSSARSQNLALGEKLSGVKAMLAIASPAMTTPKKGDLKGTIVDDKGNPIKGAKILVARKRWPNGRFSMDKARAVTDEKGKFTIKKFHRGEEKFEFNFTVLAKGYGMYSMYRANFDSSKEGFHISLVPAIKKKFRVYRDGQPVAGAKLSINNRKTKSGENIAEYQLYGINLDAGSVKTDKEGYAELPYLTEGDEVLLVAKRGKWSKELTVTINAEPEQNFGEPAGKESAANELAGVVVDADGEPVAKADVLISHKSWPGGRFHMKSYKLTTGKHGSFSFDELESENIKQQVNVTVIKDGWTMVSEYIDLADRPEALSLQLEPAVGKTFKILDASGKPVQRMKIHPAQHRVGEEDYLLYPTAKHFINYSTDENGEVVMDLFATGSTVCLDIDGQRVEFKVDDKEEQTIQLE